MSTVAQKIIIAVSGALLVLFLIAHAAGNLKIFFGARSFDSYAQWLRAESQTPDGQALRDDEHFAYVAAWEHTGEKPVLHKEKLVFESVHPAARSYR